MRFIPAFVLGTLLSVNANAETIFEAMSSAYNTNPVLQSGRASSGATNENAAIARSGFRPNISANANYTDSNYHWVSLILEDPTDTATISNIYIEDNNYEYLPMTFGNSATKFESKDGQAQIKDIIYVTRYSNITLEASMDARYNNYGSWYLNDVYRFEWYIDWLEDFDKDMGTSLGRKSYYVGDIYNVDPDIKNYVGFEYVDNYLNVSFYYTGDDPIPAMYKNYVLYCVVENNYTNTRYETERYQISYIELDNLPSLTIKDENNVDGNIEIRNVQLEPTT